MKDAFQAIKEVLHSSVAWVGQRVPMARQSVVKKTLVVAVGLYLVVGVLSWIAIYGLGWQSRLAADISSFYPNTPAIADGHWLSFADYVNLQNGLATSKQSGQSARQIDQTALGELLNQYAVDTWVKQHNIKVNDQQVATQVEANFKLMGGDKAALQSLRSQGMTKAGYTRLVKTYMEAAAISQQLVTDPTQLQAAKQKATSILDQAKAGTDFGKLVQRYSEDVATDNQQTPGLLSTDKGTLPAAVAAAINGLREGQLAGQPVGTNGAYYVAKRVHDTTGGLAAQVIVIRPESYQQWLANQVSGIKLVRLLPQLR